jgi:hypothetical protein
MLYLSPAILVGSEISLVANSGLSTILPKPKKFYKEIAIMPLLFLIIMAISSSGCSSNHEEGQLRIERISPLSEHSLLLNQQLSNDIGKQVGEDCSIQGKTECVSGLCIHASLERQGGYFCSKTCSVTAECPKDWKCGPISPNETDVNICLPPKNWKSATTNQP